MVGKIPTWWEKFRHGGKNSSLEMGHGRNKRQGGVHEGIINQVILLVPIYGNLPELYPQSYVPLCSFFTTFMYFKYLQRWSRGKSGRLNVKGSLVRIRAGAVCFEN
jgi:hypothetical protein